jgi:hypothetical protein
MARPRQCAAGASEDLLADSYPQPVLNPQLEHV